MSRDKNKTQAQRLDELRGRNQEILRHSGNFSPSQMIESGQATRYSAKREMLITIIVLAAAIALFGAFFLVLRFGFRIKTVEVTNKTDFYADRIIEASGINSGASFFFTSAENAQANVLSKIPYAANVKVKKIFPSKVTISLEKAVGRYYVSAGGKYYVLDKDMTVIDCTGQIENVELMGCIRLQSKEISECILGKKISFYDVDTMDVLCELIGLLEEKAILGFCNSIVLDSKFDIRFECFGKYTVLLGDLRDLELKIALMQEVIDDLPDEAGGKIDVSDKNLRKAIVTLYD